MPYRVQAPEPNADVLVPEKDPDGVMSYDEIAALPSSKLVELITMRMMVALPALPGFRSTPIHINGDRAAQEFDRRMMRG